MASRGAFRRFLRMVLLEDWALKIVCFILAVIFWVYIDGELSDNREVVVPLYAEQLKPHLPRGLTLAPGTELPELQVEVRGMRRRLQYFTGEYLQPDFTEVLKNLPEGPNEITLRPQDIRVDERMPEVQVVAIRKPTITLKLNRTYTKELPVRARVVGKLRPGFNASDIKITPDRVSVQSSRNLDDVDVAFTEPIDVDGRDESLSLDVAIDSRAKEYGDAVLLTDRTVAVHLEIRREDFSREIKGVPLLVFAPQGASLRAGVETLDVVVTGAPDDIRNLGPENVRLYVEWPEEWDLKAEGEQEKPAKRVQVKCVPIPGVRVGAGKDAPLPTVEVRGTVSGAPKKTEAPAPAPAAAQPEVPAE
ncbi:MAG: hypothetical protein L6R28_21035 [Planctomycetes bacterium]|nr:hypothetical protein [Planctomycetota bacterium]